MLDGKKIIIGVIALLTVFPSCQRREHSEYVNAEQKVRVDETAFCRPPQAPVGELYESWDTESGLIHLMNGGIDIDVGAPGAQKYVARSGATSWLDPEYISSELAAEDELNWAAGRYVRWLTGTQATFHFPFYPDEWQGNIYVELGLRPKMNPSMAVRFYRPDGKGGRTWSEPLTVDLTPGWHTYRWRVPREWLAKDGMQIMRASFPGSYFEGEHRVSAKFVRMSIGLLDGDDPVTRRAMPILPRTDAEMNPERPARVLDHAEDAYHLRTGSRLDRFLIVPGKSSLSFYLAPGAWLESPGIFHVDIMTDAEKKSLAEIRLEPGDCWKTHQLDLSPYAGQGARISMYFENTGGEDGFSESPRKHAQVYLASPEIRVSASGLADARQVFSQAKRIVVLAVDNLRADRIAAQTKRRAVPNLSRMADAGLSGIVMGEARSFVAMTASVLTGVSADVHGVTMPGIHLRTGLTTIAEAASLKGWKSAFYSTSAIVDSSRGFAQGFDDVHQLSRENVIRSSEALAQVSASIKSSPEHSLYYVHLGELRLPYRGNKEKFAEWSVPGYAGPVDEAAMQNLIVMVNPGRDDGRQLEAYYDAELYDVDAAIGDFAKSLDADTLLIVYGTHGNSLGETTLGYEQSLSPWELLTPYLFYMNGKQVSVRRSGVVRADEISASILDLIGADYPAGIKTIFEPHDSRPRADDNGLTAAAASNIFYRLRREGVETVYTTGLSGETAVKDEKQKPILYRAMREKIR